MRGHKLLTKELAAKLPELYSQDGKGEEAVAVVKFFSLTGWRWYAIEFDGVDTFFGLVEGFETELGYFSLQELESVTVFGGLPAVERDLHWIPRTLGELR